MLLKTPMQIRNLNLNNRLVMPPMAIRKCTHDGLVTEDFCKYYQDRTKGGHIGLIVFEHAYISRQGMASIGQYSLADDRNIEALKKLTSSMQQEGTKVVAQLNHTGSAAKPETSGFEALAPSPLPHPTQKSSAMPRELTIEEIHQIEEMFVQSALRAKAAGFDGVQLHAAHGYLLDQFYSPLSNLRKDEYGADCIENRIRIHVETYRKVRAAVGDDYPIIIRFGGCDYIEGGSTIEDAVAASVIFEKEGVDMIDISGGMCSYTRKDCSDPGYFGDTTAAIKKAVSTPVLLTGGIRTVEDAERFLTDGSADLIGVGRPILADADWAKNFME